MGKRKKHVGSISSPSKKGYEEEESPIEIKVWRIEETKERIKNENSFVKTLVDLIPPRLYFDHETFDELNEDKHAAIDNKMGVLQKLKKSKEPVSQKSKQIRARFDPEHRKTVSELICQMQKKNEKPVLENKGVTKEIHLDAPSLKVAGREELQQRLEDKLSKLKYISKLPPDQLRQRQQLKRRLSKQKSKQRKKLAKAQNGFVDESVGALPNHINATNNNATNKPAFNKDGKMVFSKFDFTESRSKPKKGEYSGKNFVQLLEKVKKDKEKLNDLKVENPEKFQAVKEKKMWKSAVQKCEGIKVKDDPTLLKKSIKKKEKIKKKSAKEWNSRLENVQKLQEDKQKKRQKNIKDRKQEKLKSKLKQARKKGRLIPGF